jgi:transcriptional regulator with XRE-family HTH domain
MYRIQDKIRAARLRQKTLRGLTQAEVALAAGVNRASVAQWEASGSNRTRPTLDNLRAITPLFEVGVDWLLDDSQGPDTLESAVEAYHRSRRETAGRAKKAANDAQDVLDERDYWSTAGYLARRQAGDAVTALRPPIDISPLGLALAVLKNDTKILVTGARGCPREAVLRVFAAAALLDPERRRSTAVAATVGATQAQLAAQAPLAALLRVRVLSIADPAGTRDLDPAIAALAKILME